MHHFILMCFFNIPLESKSLPTNVPAAHSYNKPAEKHVMLPQTVFTMKGQRPSNIRTRDMIEDSGAYTRDRYVSKPSSKPYNKE